MPGLPVPMRSVLDSMQVLSLAVHWQAERVEAKPGKTLNSDGTVSS